MNVEIHNPGDAAYTALVYRRPVAPNRDGTPVEIELQGALPPGSTGVATLWAGAEIVIREAPIMPQPVPAAVPPAPDVAPAT